MFTIAFLLSAPSIAMVSCHIHIHIHDNDARPPTRFVETFVTNTQRRTTASAAAQEFARARVLHFLHLQLCSVHTVEATRPPRNNRASNGIITASSIMLRRKHRDDLLPQFRE